jgi:hypothetical protein
VAANNLVNFGTPGLNGDRSAVLQPIFANRFRTTFYNFGGTSGAPYDLTRQCKSIGMPKLEFEEQKLWTYSQPTYVINRGEWQTVEIKFYSDIGNTVLTLLEQQFAMQQNFYDQTYARAGENYKFDLDHDILAGGGSAGGASFDPNILQKWSYSGCMLTGRDYGEMDTEEQKAVMYSVTMRFDNVTVFDQNGNRMGSFSHDAEIASQQGILSTLGVNSNVSVSISGSSISVGGSFSF